MNKPLLQQVRNSLPAKLNAGILQNESGPCLLGFMLFVAGVHPIGFFGRQLSVAIPPNGGLAVDVVAEHYDLPREEVLALARANDATPQSERSAVVRDALDALLERALA
jgi:hypothetical protein